MENAINDLEEKFYEHACGNITQKEFTEYAYKKYNAIIEDFVNNTCSCYFNDTGCEYTLEC